MRRQQVECQIDALQQGMDHFLRQLSAQIIIIKSARLQKCLCYEGSRRGKTHEMFKFLAAVPGRHP